MAPAPIGHCIYCGCVDDLRAEHVIPYGLGGDFELPAASCAECAKETSKIEEAVLREHLTGPRLAIGYPTRHSRRRGTIPPYPPILGVDANGQKTPLSFARGQHPTLLWLPQFEQPGCLSDREITGIRMNGVEMRQLSGPNINAYAKTLGFVGVEWSQNVRGYEFARMLAKIALGFAANEFGIDYRTSPLADTILNRKMDAGQWVGQPSGRPPPLAETYVVNKGLHIVKLYREQEVRAIINLFALKNSTMEYLVVVSTSNT